MHDSTPTVSVGLPIYNGEDYVEVMVDSILSQTLGDFELIISDNASTDSTVEICERYARADKRIRFFRQERNTGVAENLNFVFRQSTAKLFCWAAHDDVMLPSYLEQCHDALNANPDAVLAFSRASQIDEQGNVTGEWRWSPDEIRVGDRNPHTRFRDLIMVYHGCSPIYGMFRADALARTPLNGKWVQSDRNLLAELGLTGTWVFIPELLLQRRRHPADTMRVYPSMRDRIVVYDPDWDGGITFPLWRTLAEFARSVARADVGYGTRLACYWECAKWALLQWKPLTREILSVYKAVARLRRSPIASREELRTLPE